MTLYSKDLLINNSWWTNFTKNWTYNMVSNFEAAKIMSALNGSGEIIYSFNLCGEISNINLIIDYLNQILGNPVKITYNSKNEIDYISWIGYNYVIVIELMHDYYFSIYSTDKELFDLIAKYIKKNVTTEYQKTKGFVYVLVQTNDGFKFQKAGIGGRKLIRDNYSSSVLNDFDMVIQEFEKTIPRGRLVILQGIPGTGKSFFIKGLLNELEDSIFIIITSEQINYLFEPLFISSLLDLKNQLINSEKNKSITLIIEDADSILVTRSSDNVSAISALLNFADGIIGDSLNIRFICSTNANKIHFDAALMRPGRLLKKIKIEPLTKEEASKVYKRLTGKSISIENSMTLAQVYSLALGDNVEERKLTKVGF